MHRERLFFASCIALIATAMSFAIRIDIMADLEGVFGLTQTQLGTVGTIAFLSFGLTILFGGPLVDLLGMGLLLRVAAFCHVIGIIMTIFAPNYGILVLATFLVGAGNGLVEAVCNPLIATIYPDEKSHRLTLFHAWFPGGFVIGGLLTFGFTQIGLGWQLKMAMLLVPAAIYLFLIFAEKFPPTERVASNVPYIEMFLEAFRRPLFIVVFLVMWLTASTELGVGSWLGYMFGVLVTASVGAGVLFPLWGNALMFVLRQFASKWVSQFSPIGLIAFTAPLSAAGLFLFYYAEGAGLFFVATTLLYVGLAFWWPTMLGITSERCPRTGAVGLAIIGAAGSMSTAVSGPIIGYLNDEVGQARSLQIWSILPVLIFVIFGVVYMRDKTKGGYHAQVEKLHVEPKAMPEEAPIL